MEKVLELILGAIESAFITLLDYLSLHVLLCLIPAFFIAGAMAYFIPKDLIMKYIGENADPKISYPMATAGGFLLAVCSCTVLPLFVGIWKRGAGLGPAITFLFVAPAINILALTYTGTLIGLDIAIARGILAIVFALLIGFLMSKLFGNITGEISKSLETSSLPDNDSSDVHINTLSMVLIIILIIVSVSLAVFTTDFIMSITENYPIFQVILHSPSFFQSLLFLIGVIVLLVLSFRLSRELVLFLWLIYILMTGTSQITYFKEPMTIFMFIIPPSFMNMGSKLILSLSLILILLFYLKNNFEKDELKAWMQETWFFVRSIFPLIIIGVTLAGFVKFFIPQEIIASLVGQNTIFSNLIAVLFGVFAYFPTLMEVPIARIFLDFGMARGPLLAYLLADPELSIQSILVTRKFLGDQKNLVFIGLVIVFTVFAGLLFGGIINEGIRLI